MDRPYYESDDALVQYLWLHYAERELNFPVQCVAEMIDAARLPSRARALDLGCAVGRTAFELARWCEDVVGVDHSRRFIEAAQQMQDGQTLDYEVVEQGELKQRLTARAPGDVDRLRVHFERGDAQALRGALGAFDVVVLANLLCRLTEPQRCLAQLAELVRTGGQLVITTPSTWKHIHTPRANWLGGFTRDGVEVRTLDGLHQVLDPHFELVRHKDLPLLIREHARKFEYIVSEATGWVRR